MPPPGHLTVYVHHPEQRHDYEDIFFPTGVVQPNTSRPGDFGPGFASRPNFLPEPGRWYCYEFMVRANTPDRRDGRIACWVDGQLIADFPNLRFRDVEGLKIDVLSIGGYINPNKVRTNKLWFDYVVAATSYIGPRRSREPSRIPLDESSPLRVPWSIEEEPTGAVPRPISRTKPWKTHDLIGRCRTGGAS